MESISSCSSEHKYTTPMKQDEPIKEEMIEEKECLVILE
jgi:hypothetical protein